jgi:hypothetical protein
MVRGRVTLLAAIGAAVVALTLSAGASAQSGGPFPDDQQPISDEYGLPPVDHHAQSGGGGGSGGGSSGVFASSGAGSTDSSLRASDVRRGEDRAGSGRGARRHSPERVGIGNPIRPPSTSAADPRSGYDVLLLVLAGMAAAGLLLAALMQLRRPGRPT